jgi:hypothetical protein
VCTEITISEDVYIEMRLFLNFAIFRGMVNYVGKDGSFPEGGIATLNHMVLQYF